MFKSKTRDKLLKNESFTFKFKDNKDNTWGHYISQEQMKVCGPRGF